MTDICEEATSNVKLQEMFARYICDVSHIAAFKLNDKGQILWHNNGASMQFGSERISTISSIYDLLSKESRAKLQNTIECGSMNSVDLFQPEIMPEDLHFDSNNGGVRTFYSSVVPLPNGVFILFCEYRMLTDNQIMKKMAHLYNQLSLESREISRERKKLQISNTKNIDLASRDPLTGLANRRTLEKYLEDRSVEQRIVFIMADLDKFKKVNDILGHDYGDRVLRAFSDVFSKKARKDDLAVRYGGEEFVLVFEGLDMAEAKKIAGRICSEVSNIRFEDNPSFKITASFGVAEKISGEDWQQTLKRADQAMYKAKTQGGNRVSSS